MTTAVAVWALTYLIHSTVLIGFAAIVSRCTTSAALRDVVWKVALVGAIATASLQNLVPKIPTIQIEAPLAEPRGAGASGPRVITASVPEATAVIFDDSAASSSDSIEVTAPAPVAPLFTMVGASIGIWMIVSMILLVRVVLARRRLLNLLAPTTPVDDAEAVGIIEELRVEARLAPITLTESEVSLSPFATHRREICVPVGFFADLSAARKRALLAHEIAHIARRDPQWLLLSEVVKAIFFFQPLNAIAQRQMRDASEFLCDDFAVVSTGMRRELAESLAGLAEVVRGSALPLSAMAEGRSRLVERVARLLSDRKPELSLAPRLRVAIGLSLVAMMFFLAPVVAAVDRAVPKPPPPPAAPAAPAPAPTAAVPATRPAPPARITRAVPSVPPAPHVAPVAPGADMAPVIGPDGIVQAPHARGPAVVAGVPAPVAAPAPPPTPAVGAAPVVAPAPATAPAPVAAPATGTVSAPRPAIAPPPPPAVRYSTGADPYASATSSRDGHYGEISLSQSDDHKSTKLEGRNVTIAARATNITFSDQRGYLRVTQEWKNGEKRYVEVVPNGTANKYVYRVNGADQRWSSDAERVILDAFGNAPKKPVTPKPAAAPRPSGAAVIPSNAKIAIAVFEECGTTLTWMSDVAATSASGDRRVNVSSPTSPSYTGSRGAMLSSPNDYSTPRGRIAVGGGLGAGNGGGRYRNSYCAGAGSKASQAYRHVFGRRAFILEAQETADGNQRLSSLIQGARERGAQFVLDGKVLAAEEAASGVAGTIASVVVETRLIRVADGEVVETRRDQSRGIAQTGGAYNLLAARLAASWKPRA